MNENSRTQALRGFFSDEAAGRSPAIRRRYARVQDHLDHFLDTTDVTFSLGTTPAAMLDAERQFASEGAFLRLFEFEELICCVPEFLSDSWLMPTRVDARAQISLTGGMLKWLGRHRLLDWQVAACAYWDAEAAVKRARHGLACPAPLPYESLDT